MNSELVSILMERDSGIAEFRGALIVSVTSPKATFFANSARKTDACSALSCGRLEILRLKLLGAVTPQNLVLGVSQRYIVVRMDQVAEAASHLVRIGMRWCSLSLSELLFILRRIGYCLEEFTTSTLARSPSSPSPFSHSFFALPTNSHSHRATRCCKFLPRSHKEKEIVYALNAESDICTEIFRVQP